MKKLVLLFLLALITVVSLAQDSIIKLEWEDIKIEENFGVTISELKSSIQENLYSEKQLELDGKKVKVKGYINELQYKKKNYYTLTDAKHIFGTCHPPSTIIELKLKKNIQIKESKKVKVIGVITLNKTNITDALDYTIEVQKIKRIF